MTRIQEKRIVYCLSGTNLTPTWVLRIVPPTVLKLFERAWSDTWVGPKSC
jgi:hypothetical protein